MRKGSKRNDWSYNDEKFLKDNAGILSRREICYELKRSRKSVEMKAEHMGLSLRQYKQKLKWCNNCARLRSTVSDKTGKCYVCKLKESLHEWEVDMANAYRQLTQEDKDTYDKYEATRKSKIPPKPLKQSSCPVSRYQRAKAEETYQRDLERWEIRCLQIRINAVKQRVSRMNKKIREYEKN